MSLVQWDHGTVHTSPARGIRKPGALTLKAHQMFSVYTAPKEIKDATITGHFLGLRFRKTRLRKSRDYRDTIFDKLLKLFSVLVKRKNRRFQISPVCRAFPKSCVFVTD